MIKRFGATRALPLRHNRTARTGWLPLSQKEWGSPVRRVRSLFTPRIRARQLIKRMLADEDDFPDEEPIIHQWNIRRQGKKPAVHVSRTPQPEEVEAEG